MVQAGPARLDTEIEKYFDMSVVLLPVAEALNGIGTSITSMETVGALLDTALDRAGTAAQERFILLLNGHTAPAVRSPAVPASWDYESWTDDLDRAVAALSHQDFTATARLLEHWLSRFPAGGLDDRGLYLHARSLVLLGDSRRDQGQLRGPRSAAGAYRAALAIFTELGIPRRVAHAELSLTVVAEMTGQLGPAAISYARLAEDERLSARDRARARLWIGTALSKDAQHGHAARVITAAAHELEELGEADDWSVAHQKLALAYRGAGDLSRAQRLITIARDSGTDDTPLQKVRLAAAQAHILLTDPATRTEGLTLLDGTASLAAASGLSHQLSTIESIRRLAS